MKTAATKISEIKREKHVIDVKDKVLGRAATDSAKLLMGKAKPNFVRNLDCGDYVTVLNAKYVKLSGKKETGKKYYRYSGYPGGLRVETPATLRVKKPEELVMHAVKGMLPQNKLRDKMLARLLIHAEGQEKENN
jgi:large subunit ribosomal protein L13